MKFSIFSKSFRCAHDGVIPNVGVPHPGGRMPPSDQAPRKPIPVESPWTTLRVDDIEPVVVGPGCIRIDLPSPPNVRVWVVDMAPGSQWPIVDFHEAGEAVFVVRGELIEGDQRLGPGSYVAFAPDSRHRSRTETGVRLFGMNPLAPVER
ncbi:cupin domain-containing protein [Myxococcaceae bacterium JPH2]|nr:cupin domain-containing protein [Myxococcaceae bacterium JPH2]